MEAEPTSAYECPKHPYADQLTARISLAAQLRKGMAGPDGRRPARTYPCDRCDAWHITARRLSGRPRWMFDPEWSPTAVADRPRAPLPRLRLWDAMDRRRRHVAGELVIGEVPGTPGVYAWYLGDEALYVGMGASLRDRLGRHLRTGSSLKASSLRRNVADQVFGIAPAHAIKLGEHRLSQRELRRVREFLEVCSVAWRTCDSVEAARELERAYKSEWTPELTRQ